MLVYLILTAAVLMNTIDVTLGKTSTVRRLVYSEESRPKPESPEPLPEPESPELPPYECDPKKAEEICYNDLKCPCEGCSVINRCKRKVCRIDERCNELGYYSMRECMDNQPKLEDIYYSICDTLCNDEDEIDIELCDFGKAERDCNSIGCGCEFSSGDMYGQWLAKCSLRMCTWQHRCHKNEMDDMKDCMIEYPRIEEGFYKVCEEYCPVDNGPDFDGEEDDDDYGPNEDDDIASDDYVADDGDITIDEPEGDDGYVSNEDDGSRRGDY